ncbi:MAG: hypothetical protein V4584_11020 [Verrucomicrobiota bacterium]
MKLHPSLVFAALGLFGFGGFFAGRISSPVSSADAVRDAGSARTSRSAAPSGAAASAAGEKSRSARRERTGSAESSQDRLQRLESIIQSENALDRNRALLAYIDQLAPGDFEEAIEHFRSLGLGDNRNGEFALLLSAWAKTDPLTALTYAREKTNGGFATNTILTSWATADPEAAIQWAIANHEGDEGNRFFAGIIRGLAGSDPARATALLTSMPRGDERGDALEEMVPHILKSGPDQARTWVAGIDDETLRNGLMNEMAEPMAEKDPKGTAAWLIANPGEASNRRMDDVFEKWAEKYPQDALASFNSLPAGDARTNALEGLAGTLAKEDPKAAVALLDRYPGDVNDGVVQAVVWDSFRNDPMTAADQIARITNEGQRDQMYRRALGRWMERDPASANAWLQQNPVSENVMNHLARQQAERRE